MNERNAKRRRKKRKRRARRRKSRRKFQTNQRKVKRTSRLEIEDTGIEMIHVDAEVMPMTNAAAEMMVNGIEKTVKRRTGIKEGITTTETEQKEIAEMEEEIGMIVQMLI